MNPPTEQLIRDYLNRVSVAARGRLSADDRRAFLARTREFIEQNTRAIGRTQTADVLKLLSELGDPASLVHAERQRLAAGATEPGASTPADTSLSGRARRLRAAPANVASLLRASATVVAPGDAPAVAEPSDDNPLTGDFEEIVHARRPINSRWRPGQIVVPRQPRQRRPGLRRPGGPSTAARTVPPPPAEPVAPPAPSAPSASPEAAASPAPEAAPRARPEWPSVTARRPAPPAAPPDSPEEKPEAADGDAPTAPPGDWASLSAAETGWADAAAAGGNWTDPATGPAGETGASPSSPASLTNGVPPDPVSRPAATLADPPSAAPPDPVSRPGAALADPPPAQAGEPAAAPDDSFVYPIHPSDAPSAPDADTGLPVPPRGARVTWAAGVRSRAMRMSARRSERPRPSEPRSEPEDEPGPGWEFLATAGAAAGRASLVVARFARQHPLEAVAVVLLGLGGLIYPPVWLMGALVAMFSKLWDIRDKWIGMGLPVFLVVVGIVVEVSLSSTHKDWTVYVRDAWLFAGHLSRILALLGAVYLAWRAYRGPRNPTIPPWKKGRRTA